MFSLVQQGVWVEGDGLKMIGEVMVHRKRQTSDKVRISLSPSLVILLYRGYASLDGSRWRTISR